MHNYLLILYELMLCFPAKFVYFWIYYTKTDEPKKDMISLSEFLNTLRTRWLEPIVYTKIAKPFSVSVEEIPLLIPTLLIYLERKFATLNVTKRVSTWNLVQNLQVKFMVTM